MKFFIYLNSILFICLSTAYALPMENADDLYKKVQHLLKNEQSYILKKEDELKKLKQKANYLVPNKKAYFDAQVAIYEHYKKFQSDSAIAYISKARNVAQQIADPQLLDRVNLDLANLYSTTGLYVEAKNLLVKINRDQLNADLLSRYYDTYSSFYSHYGQSNNIEESYHLSEVYRDSLLQVLDHNSVDYRIAKATKILFQGDSDAAEKEFSSLLNQYAEDLEKKAILSYFLGLIHKQRNNNEQKRYYFTLSACADIELANRDNASLQSLALTYYEQRDFDLAFMLIEKAIQDAITCNVRYRVIESTSFYPIINSAYQAKIQQQKEKLMAFLILISLLSVVLVVGVVYIYKQMKHLTRARQDLSQTNLQLQLLNEDMNKANRHLSEANHIKEEYIAQFFDLCSTYIDKLELQRKSTLKLVSSNQIKTLQEQLRSTEIVDHEVEELYKNFDRIFLNMYPSFIQDFNALLLREEQIWPKNGELLNTELRIFALIRLGIVDSVKIAAFLRYSLRTVYNYRTKVRNKAAVARNDFEDIVKTIGFKQ